MAFEFAGKKYAAIVAGVAWIVTYFVMRGLLEMPDWGRTARIMIALVPAVPAAFFLLAFMKGIAQLDELERKVQMEAFAFAFPLTVFMLMFLGLLQVAIDLDPANWSYRHVWAFVPIFYFGGLALAWRKYR
jgi:hypothetical protein